MKFTKTILLLITLSIANIINAQTISISGKVTNKIGEPVTYASVTFQNTTFGTTTNDHGNYAFETIPAGKYNLVVTAVGYDDYKKAINIQEDAEPLLLDITMERNSHSLEEVTVTANGNGIRESEVVAKMPLKNLENPQVYNVVSTKLMKEQMLTSYQEALNNIPGATTITVTGGNGGTYIKMRGFYTTGGFRDGLPVSQYAGSDPVNIEKIEAIKGPSGALFGSTTSYGGLVNRVTKKPYEELGGEINFSYGSYNLSRLTVDLNTPVNKNKTVLFRINAALHDGKSFQDYGYKRTNTISPSLLIKVTEKLNLLLNSEFYSSKWIGTYYNYSFPTGMNNISQIPVQYNQSIIGSALESSIKTTNHIIKAEYCFSSKFKSTTSFTAMENKWQPAYFYALKWIKDSMYIRSISKTERTTFKTINLQQNFTGDFNISNLRNRIVVGFDYYRYNADVGNYGSRDYDTINLPAVVVLPVSKTKFDNILAANPTFSTSSNAQNIIALYASNVINLRKNLMAMASIRMDRFHNEPSVSNGVSNAKNVYTQTAWSPRFGLVYQPIEERLSLFASYSNGFVNQGPVQQPDGTISIFKPEHANQIEGGLKADLFNHKLNGSISYYDILINNKIRKDDITSFQVQDGSQRNSGIEIDIDAHPANGLNIVLGYGYLYPRYLKIAKDLEGKSPTTSPRNVANFWVSYKMNNGFGLGLGGNYVDKSFGNAANTFILPSYTLLNSTAFYEFKKFRLGLKINNIGNTKYWDMTYYPQMQRQFVANVSYKF